MLLAGTLADIDLVTILLGPAAYLSGRFTYTHSLLGALIIVVTAGTLVILWSRGRDRVTAQAILKGSLLAAVVHVLLDLCTSSGVALLWPVSTQRYALDWLPHVDMGVLALLIAGILLPELLRLVTSEIGAKDKAPRGRNGALAALVILIAYITARGVLHHSAVTLLDPHTYRGESSQRIDAFAESLSVTTWRGIVETASNICLVSAPVTGERFDPEAAVCLHKPEASRVLAAAQITRTASQFLATARFPRASVDKIENGYQVVLRDMRNVAEEQTQYSVAAKISLDANAVVQTDNFVWAREVRLR